MGPLAIREVPISEFLTVCPRAQGRPAIKFGVKPTRYHSRGLFVPRKIMRGGQAAADRAGLHSAIEAGLKHGEFALGQNRDAGVCTA
jgi:hypothetical protein